MKYTVANKELVRLIKWRYPKFDKYLFSKAQHPDVYGVKLTEEAEGIIAPYAQKTPVATCAKPEGRKRPVRAYLRLTNAEFELLVKYMNVNRYESMQACLLAIVLKAIIKSDAAASKGNDAAKNNDKNIIPATPEKINDIEEVMERGHLI